MIVPLAREAPMSDVISRALDVFGAGRHTLATRNMPLLTKARPLPFGFTSPFRVQVVFVSRRAFLDQNRTSTSPRSRPPTCGNALP
jgi:hypothetical protein